MAAVVAIAQGVVLPGGGVIAPGAYGIPGLSPYGVPGVAKVGIAKVAAPIEEYDPNPQYSYSYDIAVSSNIRRFVICFVFLMLWFNKFRIH